jgi:regulator of RNase E activity RraA
MEALPAHVLDHLREFTSPTVANAIEVFNVRPRHEGFMRPEIRCVYPHLGVMAGYAATLKIRAVAPGKEGATVRPRVHWEKVLQVPAPRVVVVEDLDDPPGVGSYWGEVNANVHLALGCVGVVTNGGVRDLDEVRALRFHFFAAHISVSHAYVHIVEAGTPVRVGGLIVRPGDLLHADQHGVVNVPWELAAKIPEAAGKVADVEHRIIACSQSTEFTLDGLDDLWRGVGV